VAELESRVRPVSGGFLASDLDPLAVAAARACAEAAGVAAGIVVEQKHFEQVVPPGPEGLVVTNPPDWLVARCGGWRAAILAADTPAARQLGLRPARRVPLANGAIPCRLVELEIRPRQVPIEPTESRPAKRGWGFDEQAADFRRRLAKRFRHLSKWARRQAFEAFRVYDRDIPEIPLAIDWYAGWLHAAEYDRPHERTEIEHDIWLDRMIEAAAEELGVPPGRAFLKARRRQRGGTQYEKVAARKAVLTVREGDLGFEVNLSDYLDTGLFLDHRITRSLVRAESAGKRMLNLFSYTGSFSVAAAAGGAAETTSVDLSNTYLDWTRTNLARNGFTDAGRQRTIRDEAEQPFDVEHDHADLLSLVADNLVPGGVVFFSTNFRRFHLAAEQLGQRYTIRELTARTLPEDFRDRRPHRAWRLVRR